ncbi:hypothetical protein Tco_0046286 [Tanacetum coccineum]
MSTLTFADTHNMVAFLEKPAESDGFHEIIDFLNANQIRYALTVNPIIYTSCIQQFWATAKANTVNGECQLQALIDKKKVIIMESSIRSDLHLEDAGGTDCLPTATIFEELAWMGHLLLLNHHPLDLRRNSPRGNRGRTLQLLKRRHNKMAVFLHLSMIYLSVVLDLEKAKDAQAKEIADLKKRVHKLERQKKSRPTGLKRLRKVRMSRRVESSEDKDSLGDHEDASKQGRSIEDIDKDADVSLIDDTQGRSDDSEMFDINELHGDEVVVDMPVGEKQEQSAKKREVNTSVEDTAKPKVVTTAATTTTRPKARGVVVQEPSEFKTPQASQPSMTKDKGKAIMIEPKVPLKRKDQVALDEDLVRNLQAQLEVKLIEEERLTRIKKEEANIALIESWDNTQAMMEADFELAQRLQTEEQGEITIEERSRLMGGYKHNQLKSKSYEEIQKLFDNEMRRVNTFILMDYEEKVVRRKLKAAESSDEHDEVEEVDEDELKKHLVIVKDDDIAIDPIPLATKPPVIIEYKLLREGIMAHYQLIRADGSSKRYSSMIRMLQGIDREDLQTL